MLIVHPSGEQQAGAAPLTALRFEAHFLSASSAPVQDHALDMSLARVKSAAVTFYEDAVVVLGEMNDLRGVVQKAPSQIGDPRGKPGDQFERIPMGGSLEPFADRPNARGRASQELTRSRSERKSPYC